MRGGGGSTPIWKKFTFWIFFFGTLPLERHKEDTPLKKMVIEREEEISALRAACEGWRGKTLAVERELSEANFNVSKLERLEYLN